MTSQLYIYHVSQSEVDGYDTYSDFVGIFESEEEARKTHPSGDYLDADSMFNDWESSTWASRPEHVTVKLLGEATGSERGVVRASFHAG